MRNVKTDLYPMKSLFILFYLFSSLALAASYDECPSGLKLVGKDCVTDFYNVTAPQFSCGVLFGRFGKMDCSESAGKSCEAWAVQTCDKIRTACLNHKAKLKRGQRLPQGCTQVQFKILDPQESPSPVVSEPFTPEDEKFQKELKELSDVESIGQAVEKLNQASGPSCPVPGGSVSVPSEYLNCLNSSDTSLNDWLTVSDPVFHICQKPNGELKREKKYEGDYVKYRVRRTEGQFELSSNFRLHYKGLPENRERVVARVHAAKGCVEKFFARHKIKFNLGISTNESSWSEWWNADVDGINIWDKIDTPNMSGPKDAPRENRSDSGNWGILNSQNQDQNDDTVCSMMIHEISHRLGLPDRYEEYEKCPDRETVTTDPSSVMKTGSDGRYAERTFVADDLIQLTKRLCKYPENK